jgi:spore germination cell wall hydrolase CwlJ-like protein
MLSLLKVLILASLLSISSPVQADEKQLECLAKVVYHEARGEPLKGQEAVAHVVMNRVNSPKFPNTICEVVKQKRQFTGFNKRTNYNNFEGKLWDNSMTSAALVYLGKSKDNTKGALFYLNPNKVSKKTLTSWKRKYIVLVRIHNHKFFGVKEV